MKIAVVGCGVVSACHFAALSEVPEAEIIAVADIKHDRADAKAAMTGAKAYYDYDEMLANEKPECVHIATPHYLHTPMAIKALKSGANVFLEKPCSVSCQEADELFKAQQESGKQLGICFQNRYNDCSVIAKELIDSGTLGRVKSARAVLTWDRGETYYSDDWHGKKDKECGGVLINQAIHTIDLLQYLCGSCERLTAHTANDHLKDIIEVEDTANVRMELSGGVIALLYATTAYLGNSEVFIEIALDKALLRLEGETLCKILPDGTREQLCDRQNRENVGRSYWGHGHQAIIKDFYDCLKTGRKFAIDAAEGGKAAKIVAACYTSSALNRTVEVK